jgi:hypothetical protein
VQLWDVATGKGLARLPLKDAYSVLAAAFLEDGKGLVTLDRQSPRKNDLAGARLVVWDAPTGKRLRQFLLPNVRTDAPALVLAGRRAIMDGSDAQPLRCYDLETGREVRAFLGQPFVAQVLALTPDGHTLAAGGADGRLRLWEMITGKEIGTLSGHAQAVVAVAVWSQGGLVATASQRQVLVWDVARGKEIGRFASPASDVASLAFTPDGARLVSGMRNSTLLIWDVEKLVADARRPAGELGPRNLEALWADLAGADVRQAQQAIGMLAAAKAQAVPFLQRHLQPVAAADPQRLRRLIADLDHEQFAERQAAARELERLGEMAAEALAQALQKEPTLEARRRLERLLARLDGPVPFPEQVRALRALVVLERACTAEARQLLQKLAQGAPQARLTQHAAAALKRLSARPE